MTPTTAAFAIACLLLSLGDAARGHDWSQTVAVDQTVMLTCYDPKLHPFNLLNETSKTLPAELRDLTWYLPGEKKLDSASPPSGVSLDSTKMKLTVKATVANQGLYHCAAYFNQTQWYFIKRGVNPMGPLVSQWAIFRQPVINGLASSVVFFIWCCLLAVVYVYRWEARFGSPKGHETEPTPRAELTSF